MLYLSHKRNVPVSKIIRGLISLYLKGEMHHLNTQMIEDIRDTIELRNSRIRAKYDHLTKIGAYRKHKVKKVKRVKLR